MASKRMIARKVALSKKLSVVKWHTESLYYRGLAFLDDAGRMTADAEEYRAIVIPMGKNGKAVSLATVEASILELYHVGLVGLCECPGKKCMEVRKFDDFNTVRSDRTPQIDCLEPHGMTWYDSDIPVTAETIRIETIRIETNRRKTAPSQYGEDFEEWYQGYPRKGSKSDAFRCYSARRKEGISPAGLLKARDLYADQLRRDGTEQKFIKLAKTFLGPGGHVAEYLETVGPPIKKLNPEKSDAQIAELRKQIATIEGYETPDPYDKSRIAELKARIAKLEQEMSDE